MRVSEWIVFNNFTRRQFAEFAGMGKTHLANVLRGASPPSRRLADKIEEATRGEVNALDVMSGAALGYEKGKLRRVAKEGTPHYPK